MSIDLTQLSPIMLLVALGVILLVVYAIFRFFLGHLMHLFFRGCGLIVIIAVLYYVLHFVLKLI